MADIVVTSGDDGSVVSASLSQNGSPYDLTGCTVAMILKITDTIIPAVHVACVAASPQTAGNVTASMPNTLPVGTYSVVFLVTTGAGKKLTFPNSGPLSLQSVVALT